ncbi:MAG: hypothetical protein JJ953_14390 [Gracilimonas sp.]|uniref:porin n=1 Tax=Gracilimonas TaxID=649462 RepID=UPI001B229370|nr:porin [Gracilimonas sp.]MBO6587296.1 hypothetical protein [Gracilimonas sp.]MBO6614216.1 hypothetical protein [Gracilimonas sp.]
MKPSKKLFPTLLLAVTFSLLNFSAVAQDDSSFMDELRELFKNESLSVGALVQVQGLYDFDDQSPASSRSFSLPTARIKLSGKLDGGFNYVVHFDAADNPILLDATAGYSLNNAFNVTAGAQKPGISAEFLKGPQDLDFVSRSQVVKALAENRDIGVRVHGRFDQGLGYSLGMFNGNNLQPNDNDAFYYAGRLSFNAEFNDGTNLALGANGSYGEQDNKSIAAGTIPFIDGEYAIFGGDLRVENSGFIMGGEFLSALIDYNQSGEFDDTIMGYQVTGGFKFLEKAQFLVRWDSFQSEDIPALNSDEIVIALNYLPTEQTKIRLNYIFPPEQAELENHRIAMNFQIGF